MARRSLKALLRQQTGVHANRSSINIHCLPAKPRTLIRSLHFSIASSCRPLTTICSGFHSLCRHRASLAVSKQLSTSVAALPWREIQPFGSVRVNLTTAMTDGWSYTTLEEIAAMLKSHVSQWKAEGRSAVWLHIPIALGALIPLANEQGFTLHHASGGEVVMSQWLLEDKINKLPLYASHQVGVCGVVLRGDTNEVLVVQDKFKPAVWKFPGGLSEFAEDIADAAIREVKEETGVDTEFSSVLAFRQQHRIPRYFNISDLYYICRLRPLNFELRPCQDEIVKCRWMHVEELAVSEEATPLSHRMARLLIEGNSRGLLPSIGMGIEQLWYDYEGRRIHYKLFV